MVDTPVISPEVVVAPVVPASIPEPTPAPAEAVQAAPVVEALVPAPEPTPAPEPVVEAPKEVPETLLTAAPVEVVTEPVVVETTDNNTDGGQSAEPAPPPTYEPFTLPDNAPLEPERISEFTNLLSELELSGKADHAAVQQFGQKAIEFHINETTKTVEAYTKKMIDAFENQKTEWRESFQKDPEIGGNRQQTTLEAAKRFIATHGGTSEQQAQFRSILDSSGLGNHPAMIRLLANASVAMSEPGPLASVKPVPQTKSRTQTMYGKS